MLVTGAAGFIGFHTAQALLARGDEVVGLDNLNAYYDPKLKSARLALLERRRRVSLRDKLDIADRAAMQELFDGDKFGASCIWRPRRACAIRSSNPHVYVQSNITGFLHVLEGCRQQRVGHLVYASTSSVYGANTNMPFSERQNVDHPLTLYAATKKANELDGAQLLVAVRAADDRACVSSRSTGPGGGRTWRCSCSPNNILAGEPIDVFNEGHHQRDFTYIDDIVAGVVAAVDHIAAPDPRLEADAPDPSTSYAPYRIYNIGNQRPVTLLRYIEVLEHCLGRKARQESHAHAARGPTGYLGGRQCAGA